MRKKNFEYCEKFNDFYTTVFSKSSNTKKWVINPEIKKLIRRKFDPVVQHDSHEFMVYLLEQLQDEQTPKGGVFDGSDGKKPLSQICEEYFRVRPSIIDKLFSGIQQTIVECGKCGYNSLTCNPFMTMSLQYKATIEKAIYDHLSEEQIDGLYKCEKCKKESKARVRYEFVRLPKYLMLHIKRFDSGFNKIKSSMQYRSQLDLSQ